MRLQSLSYHIPVVLLALCPIFAWSSPFPATEKTLKARGDPIPAAQGQDQTNLADKRVFRTEEELDTAQEIFRAKPICGNYPGVKTNSAKLTEAECGAKMGSALVLGIKFLECDPPPTRGNREGTCFWVDVHVEHESKPLVVHELKDLEDVKEKYIATPTCKHVPGIKTNGKPGHSARSCMTSVDGRANRLVIGMHHDGKCLARNDGAARRRGFEVLVTCWFITYELEVKPKRRRGSGSRASKPDQNSEAGPGASAKRVKKSLSTKEVKKNSSTTNSR